MPKLDQTNVWAQPQPAEANKGKPVDSLTGAYSSWRKVRTPQNAGQLLGVLAPTIDSALTSFAPADRDALRTKARLMALRAVDTYDPKKGAKLNSHVFNSLRSLNREKARRTNVVHVPENMILEKNRLRLAKETGFAETGQEPTVEELADMTGISARRIEKLEAVGGQLSSSQTLTEKGDTFFAKTEDPQRIWADYVYHDLDAPDKRIFEWSTGYGGKAKIPKGEIARRLKISPSAVSQRIGRIVRMLEEGYSV